MGCCASVPQSQLAMVQKFGRHSRILNPGLAFLNPLCGECVAGSISLRIQQLDVKCDTKTRDNVFVKIVVSVQYQVIVDQVYDAFYKLTNVHQQITAYVFDVVRSTVPKIKLDDVFETKEEIALAVKEELTKSMHDFGYSILQALITDIDPDPKVKEAMNQINAAQRMRVAATDKAEAEKILVVKAAEADAESKYLAGVGIARQRKAIIEGLRESVVLFSDQVPDTRPKDVMDIVLMTQYFDTLKDIGAHSRASTVFVPHSPSMMNNYANEIKRGFVQGQVAEITGHE